MNGAAPEVLAASEPLITFANVQKAAQAIRGKVADTPFLHSQALLELTGVEIWLKFEDLQLIGSFKQRGALNKLLSLTQKQRAAQFGAEVLLIGANFAEASAERPRPVSERGLTLVHPFDDNSLSLGRAQSASKFSPRSPISIT